MKIGIPKGLLYSKYHIFAKSFFEEMGAEIITSPDTNKETLNAGVKYCVDEACLPIKVFHGHVSWLRNRCDYILIPRFMSIEKKKYICPMFCGLIEMVSSSIPELPHLIENPIYSLEEKKLFEWAKNAGSLITKNRISLSVAFNIALAKQKAYHSGFNDKGFAHRVALIGHTYNIHDRFINMNLIKKLNHLDIGVISAEYVNKKDINKEVSKLFKQPFWYFACQYYGAAIHLFRKGNIDGIVYVSAFSCGIDSVIIELIKDEIGSFPFMILKIDEHTGEAGFNTRIEAFADMLKRRSLIGHYSPANGEYMFSGKSVI